MKILPFSILWLIFLSCRSHHKERIYKIISGNLSGLPNGTMYLINDQNQKIDSVITNKGIFLFKQQSNDTKKYFYATLEHLDEIGIRRIFQFKTNRTYRGGPLLIQYFIVEGDTLNIKGHLLEFATKDFNLPDTIKLVYPSELVCGGNQNYALNNIIFNFDPKLSDSNYNNLVSLVNQYPYSYYLLHEIAIRRNNYSASQLEKLLSLFSIDLHEYEEAVLMKKAAEIKGNNIHTIINTQLESTENTVHNIIDTSASVNMIILWASWCGPCVAEIPELYKVYELYKNRKNFHMVSISLDTKKENWKEALTKHSMPWSHLWIQPSLAKYGMEIFQFDGSVPTILFFNNKGKLLKKISGYQNDNLDEYLETISKHIDQY